MGDNLKRLMRTNRLLFGLGLLAYGANLLAVCSWLADRKYIWAMVNGASLALAIWCIRDNRKRKLEIEEVAHLEAEIGRMRAQLKGIENGTETWNRLAKNQSSKIQ